METKGTAAKTRRAFRVLASLTLLAVLLTWTGQRPAEAETPLTCTTFGDWKEIDTFWKLFWAVDDKGHMHHTGTIPDEGDNDWVIVRYTSAFGWQHTHMVSGYTSDSEEHGECNLEA